MLCFVRLSFFFISLHDFEPSPGETEKAVASVKKIKAFSLGEFQTNASYKHQNSLCGEA